MTLKVVDNTAANPFDPKALRLTQDYVGISGVKKLLTRVPVKRPGPQDFIRVHSDPEYRGDFMALIMKEEDEHFLIHPSLHLELSGEGVPVTIFTAINRQGVVFLWLVRLPDADGKTNSWWTSARDAAEMAMSKWLRIKAVKALGGYAITASESMTVEPEWPELPFMNLLEIAFGKDGIIKGVDHIAIRRLRGLV
jgi:hypothetical protein